MEKQHAQAIRYCDAPSRRFTYLKGRSGDDDRCWRFGTAYEELRACRNRWLLLSPWLLRLATALLRLWLSTALLRLWLSALLRLRLSTALLWTALAVLVESAMPAWVISGHTDKSAPC